MTESAQFRDRIVRVVVNSVRVALYPLHCAIRIVARLFLLTSVLVAVPMPALIIVMLIMTGVSIATDGAVSDPMARVADLFTQEGGVGSTAAEGNADGGDGEESAADGSMWTLVAGTIAALASVGVVSILIQRSLDHILNSLSHIGARIWGIGRGPWFPGFEVGKSLAESWQRCIAQIPVEAWRTFAGSTKLFTVLIFTLFLAFLTYEPMREVKEGLNDLDVISTAVTQVNDTVNSTSIVQHLTSLENTLKDYPGVVIVQPGGTDVDAWKTHLDGKLEELRTSILNELQNRPRDLLLVAWDDAAAAPTQFPAGTVFSLVYPPQGDLGKDKNGICPGEANIRWLNLFRGALKACSESGPLEVTVVGYSSIAPVTKNGVFDPVQSARFNCEIANQRAKAVSHFLASEFTVGLEKGTEDGTEDKHLQWCREFLNSRPTDSPDGGLCSGNGQATAWAEQKQPNLSVKYRAWGSYSRMMDEQPTNDGTLEVRNRDIEPLNRVVQIIVSQAACWRDFPVRDRPQSTSLVAPDR